MPRTYLKSGSWNVICDRCGQRYKADELMKEWTGLFVCQTCIESRHPQDFIRAVPDRMDVPYVRPRGDDIFVDRCSYEGSMAIAGFAQAGCFRAGYYDDEWYNLGHISDPSTFPNPRPDNPEPPPTDGESGGGGDPGDGGNSMTFVPLAVTTGDVTYDSFELFLELGLTNQSEITSLMALGNIAPLGTSYGCGGFSSNPTSLTLINSAPQFTMPISLYQSPLAQSLFPESGFGTISNNPAHLFGDDLLTFVQCDVDSQMTFTLTSENLDYSDFSGDSQGLFDSLLDMPVNFRFSVTGQDLAITNETNVCSTGDYANHCPVSPSSNFPPEFLCSGGGSSKSTNTTGNFSLINVPCVGTGFRAPGNNSTLTSYYCLMDGTGTVAIESLGSTETPSYQEVPTGMDDAGAIELISNVLGVTLPSGAIGGVQAYLSPAIEKLVSMPTLSFGVFGDLPLTGRVLTTSFDQSLFFVQKYSAVYAIFG